MKKLFSTVLLCSFIFVNYSEAQILSFSQPFANPLYLNPAFAGTGGNQRIGVNFRDQWLKFPGNPVTYNAFYDRNIIDSNFGIGVLADRTNLGFETITNASLMLSYQLHIKSFTLSAGFQCTYLYKQINGSYLVFGSQITPGRGFVYNTTSINYAYHTATPDFSAGLLGYGKNYFVGFAIDHFTQPNESFISGTTSPLPIKLVANGGLMIHAGEVIISPALLYLNQQGLNEEMMQCYIIYKSFIGGIGNVYSINMTPVADIQNRYTNALTFILGYQNKLFRVAYSYDYYTSPNNSAGGTHEASLAFFIQYKSAKLKKTNVLNCPML